MNLLVLDSTAKSITARIDAGGTGTTIKFMSSYADATTTTFLEGSNNGSSNGVTEVAIVAAPGASTQRVIREMVFYNGDTVAHTLYVSLLVTSTYFVVRQVSLAVGASWSMSGDVDTFIAAGGADLKLFMNAAGTAPEWAGGIKLGTFSYDTATASGTQAITGVGFKPSHILLLVSISSTTQLSIGWSNGTVNYCLSNGAAYSATLWFPESYVSSLYQSNAIWLLTTVSTLGADGFTLTHTKTGAKTGTATYYYMAFR